MASNNSKWWRYHKSFKGEDRSFFKKSLEKNLFEFILQKKNTQKNHSGNFTKKQNKMLCGNFTKKLLKNILMFLGNLMAFFILLRIILEEKILMQIPPFQLRILRFYKIPHFGFFFGVIFGQFFYLLFLGWQYETIWRKKCWDEYTRKILKR